MTFVEATTALLAHLRLRGYSPATIDNYGDQLQRFGEWLDAALADDLRRITRDDIDMYQAYVRSEPVAADTRALRLRAVKRLFDHLVHEGQLLMHPAEHVVEMRRKDRLPRAVLSVKRRANASPATGSAKAHEIEERTLIDLAFGSAV